MKEYPTELDKKDKVLSTVKTIVSAVPYAGAPVVELLNAIVTPSLQKRRDEWFQDIGERLEKLEEELSKSIKLYNNDINKIIDTISSNLVKLVDITIKIGSGATPRGGESSYKSNGITLIRSQNIHDNRFIKKGLAFIDEEQARKLDNVTVQKKDVLFNITGASIARCCMVDDKYLPARVNQHVSIIRTNEKANSKYLQMMLISSIYKNKLLAVGDGGASREAITKSQLEEFKIPLPAIEEQEKIVKTIESIEKKITQKEQEIANIPKQKEKILDRYLK